MITRRMRVRPLPRAEPVPHCQTPLTLYSPPPMAVAPRFKISLPPQVALLATIILWGCSFIASKAALRELSPVPLVFLRFALGTGLLVAVCVMRREPLVPPRNTWPMLALMGFIGVFVHHLLQGYGLQTATAVHSGWLIA